MAMKVALHLSFTLRGQELAGERQVHHLLAIKIAHEIN